MNDPIAEFRFKPFREMTDEDYRLIGFRSGLEIHQQLLTEKKLFCRCPAGLYSDHYNAEILREMRPTLSELGEYDGTALMEFKTKKEIVYRINYETVCTYEMDDTPPFELNEEALDIAIGIAMLYRCSLVDEIHIARKQYLDGSIPTGFQRTTIVGVEGSIPYKDREIRIVQLGLEEDACREVSDRYHRRVYITDRLGMPLIETVTGADMRTPHEIAEVADLCRRIVRSTGQVRTGIGAARQDVNVSVTGGTRIEIKGVPRIPAIPLLTYNEAMRQWNLLRLKRELERRGITAETFRSRTADVTQAVRKTRYRPLAQALAKGFQARCVVLEGFRGLLAWETQTNTRFGKEISDRVRVIECLMDLPNIAHSDGPEKSLPRTEWKALRTDLAAGEDDTLVIVWGPETDVETGAKEIAIRAREAAIGVPSETRQALKDGTNGFERILPGPDRMYPDTDLPPKRITQERLERIRATLPEPVWERERRYRELGVPPDTIVPLSISPYAALFNRLVTGKNVEPVRAAVALVQYTKRLARRYGKDNGLAPETVEGIFDACIAGRLAWDAILPAMDAAVRRGSFDALSLPPPCTDEEADGVIREEAAFLRENPPKRPERFGEILIGRAMRRLRGRIPAPVVVERVRRLLEEERR
ncbi:MAG: Glu-tRNA(Gln) amidotransferase subunit GatE [Bacteroidota bacterium]|nr:Glu-tRNA(Gln) amidotransferase subunit GatE [Bacteroidota bacterium]